MVIVSCFVSSYTGDGIEDERDIDEQLHPKHKC
jgi:hypothetical protein